MYLRLGDFLVSCVTQLTSRKAGAYSFGFLSDQVLCSRIVRFIVTGHDGILPVDGALPAPIVPHNGEIQQPMRATAVLSERLHTRRAARVDREKARAP